MTSPLDNAAVDLQGFRQSTRDELASLLSSNGTDIALVLDPSLVGPIGQIAEVSLLKSHGVSNIYTLSEGPLDTESASVVYIVRPDTRLIPLISQQVHLHNKEKRTKFHSVIFVPRRSMLVERALAELGVYGEVQIGEFELDIIPQDEDVLNMELPGSFKTLFVERDPSVLLSIAKAILKLEKQFGRVPDVFGKGDQAEQVLHLVKRLRREHDSITDDLGISGLRDDHYEIDQMILLDRSCDLVSPLMSQQTYEGLLDEKIGIINGYVDVEKEILGLKDKQGVGLKGNKKLVLNSADTLYREVRDLTFSGLGAFLKGRAAFISKVYEERHKAETISQISEFMKKFKALNKEHSSLQSHINLAEFLANKYTRTLAFDRRSRSELGLIGFDESIEEYLEDCIGRMEPLYEVLSLWCLMVLIGNGMKAKKIEFFKHEILQTYGFQHVLTLNNLERLGLLKVYQSRGPWNTLRKNLKLFKDKSVTHFSKDERESDLTNVFEGYAPISARIVEQCSLGRWSVLQETLKSLPGRQFMELLPQRRDSEVNTIEGVKKNPLTLVFFIGGVTYSEISALRILSKDPSHKGEYLIATTHILNKKRFMEEFAEVEAVDVRF